MRRRAGQLARRALQISLLPLALSVAALAQGSASTTEEDFKDACVDSESAMNLGKGSPALAASIAADCVTAALKRFHFGTSLKEVQAAERQAPGGVIVDLIGKIPGVGDTGPAGLYTLRAEENFDCHARVPGGQEMICNSPIDRGWMEGDWPYYRDQLGEGRERFDRMVEQTLQKNEMRRQKLRALIE